MLTRENDLVPAAGAPRAGGDGGPGERPMIYQEPRISVVVADDHPVTREGVVRALKSSGKIEVVASVADGRAALEAIRELRPAVALLDYKMPELDGLQVIHAVTRESLPTNVVLLSAFDDSPVVYKAPG
jgi:two-component system, NarL family, nitrate/nitrite response regulator NarL